MKLTEKQQQLVIKKLERTKKSCYVCENKKLIISDRIFEVREFNSGNLIIGGKKSSIYPLIAVACPDCGNVQFFNAILMGIMSKDNNKTISTSKSSKKEK